MCSEGPAFNNQAVFVNTYTGVGPAKGVWNKINVSAYVPVGTKAIHLSGLLIITHGSTAETADLVVKFRKVGGTDDHYHAQCIEAATGGGQRSTMATWVPLDENLEFEMKYTVTNPNATWPTYSAYGINLSIDAYAA